MPRTLDSVLRFPTWPRAPGALVPNVTFLGTGWDAARRATGEAESKVTGRLFLVLIYGCVRLHPIRWPLVGPASVLSPQSPRAGVMKL